MLQITPNIDLALLTLYTFWVFFAGLIFYLLRENRREGYPLMRDAPGGGQVEEHGTPSLPVPKTFLMADGHTVTVPEGPGDTRPVNAEPAAAFLGAPIEPVGNPLTAGVGPGAFAERADHPELARDGRPNIVPLRAAAEFWVAREDTDPRGMDVIGGDGEKAGTISEIWIDRAEYLIRYLEVDTGARHVLLPITFADISNWRKEVKVSAIFAKHFAGVPGLKNPDEVTVLEEEKIAAYYGAGTLYADASRAEPLI